MTSVWISSLNPPSKKIKLNDGKDNVDKSKEAKSTDLSSSLGNLFNNPHMSDVQLKVEPEGKCETFYAHKLILSSRSDVFNAMFNGPLKSNENPEIVKIEDIEPECFAEFLKFLYTDKYTPSPAEMNIKGVFGVLYTADKYNVQSLVKACRDFIKTNLKNWKQRLEIFAFKRLSAVICPELVEDCWNLIDKTAENIIQGDEFLGIKNDELCEFLRRDGLIIPELDLFNATVKTSLPSTLIIGFGLNSWARNHCRQCEFVITPKRLRKVLGQALFLIRFPVMNQIEFAVHVLPEKLLTTQEERDILHSMALIAANDPSLEFPKTKFNCTKRTEQDFSGWQRCDDCTEVGDDSGSYCPCCGNGRRVNYCSSDYSDSTDQE